MPTCNKLVRTRIPDIIERSNKKLTSLILTNDEYSRVITKKTYEDFTEYDPIMTIEGAVGELADLLKIIYATDVIHNTNFEEMEKIRVDKANKPAPFDKRTFQIEVNYD